ncbi:MAG: guanylate kinase [Coraliomargarita sp. TMED73]|nr:MAG: guanylate kinase [Coraliomargarita sp. TMED73]
MKEPNSIGDKGRLLIVSGPAGSGKTTVCNRLLEVSPKLERVITATTRAPRGDERDGLDYYFLNAADFEERIGRDAFYEYARVHGNHYGTLKSEVQEKLLSGMDLLLNIDVQGAASFRQTADQDPLLKGRIATVFIMPPSREELEKRLRGRGTDTEDEVRRRLHVAEEEMKQAQLYDYILMSADKDADFHQLLAIYQSEGKRDRPSNPSGRPNTSA